MSANKAVTSDGFSDNWFRKTKIHSFLQDWWNNSVMQMLLKQSFECRLIPLNKAFPNIPTKN